MPNYANGKIYKIVCNITNEIYIGSTTQSLSKRLAQHRDDYNQYLKQNRNNISSFSIIERGNYEIVLIENVSCENNEQLHREERKHIEANICVNNRIPTRTGKEWYESNKDKKKEYYEDNKYKILEKRKEWYEDNKEKVKEWYEDNKETIAEKQKKYQKENKDIISERQRLYYLKKKDLGKTEL